MAGRNQHHFWQVLQRGFGIERKPGFTTVFAYQKGKPPFNVGTKNLGAERDFFDFAPGDGADDLITKTENDLQGLVRHLQNGGHLAEDHTAMIALLIAHLETRTKFLRQHLAETLSDLTGGIYSWFADPHIFQKMMKRHASDSFAEIDTQLAKHVSDPSIRAALRGFMIDNIDQLGANVIKTASDNAAEAIKSLAEKLQGIAKQSHIKAILNIEPNNTRSNRYLDLKYRTQSRFSGNLICPDTMVAFLTDQKPKPFLDIGDQLEAVWIPLTSDLMLIGESGASVDRTHQSVLRVLASTSYSTFIANSDAPDLRKLSSRIGKNAEILSATETKAIMRETLSSLL
ncbi:hypothetical protein RNZ50_01230 [Paracoccaceae bacterium Fryx2]|nr:hypothetical protein [Paracoccaceae bacterium Fryx2]